MQKVAKDEAQPRKGDRWIPWMIVLFFVVFMVVDAVMVTLAVTTQTGVVTEQAYEKGLAYNDTLKSVAEQETWGWKETLSLSGDNLAFSLKDNDGTPVPVDAAKALAVRPVQSGSDFSIPLKENADGSFSTEMAFPHRGQWAIRVFATSGKRTYQTETLVVVK